MNEDIEIPQSIESDPAWQCPYCGDWFLDGEKECGDCGYQPNKEDYDYDR